MSSVTVCFRLPWRGETLVRPLPGPQARVEDILEPVMDERSRGAVMTVLNKQVCFGSDLAADGDTILVLPIILGG